MKEFLFLIHGNKYPDESPEALEKYMEDYNSWMNVLLNRGLYVTGSRLTDDGRHLQRDGTILTDGPFLEPKEIIGGFILVKAEDLSHALDLAKSCPLSEDFDISIRPLIPHLLES